MSAMMLSKNNTRRKTSSRYDLNDEWSSVPSNPTFNDLSTNSIAVVPLLAESRSLKNKGSSTFVLKKQSNNNPHTDKSFISLMNAFSRYSATSDEEQHDMMVHASRQRRGGDSDGLSSSSSAQQQQQLSSVRNSTTTNTNTTTMATLLIPNSQLTRPGDWRYDATPLVNFDWNSGCQRLHFFDARPNTNRCAYERIQNPTITAPWSDLIPSRTTIAVVGVLNLRDCLNTDHLLQAEHELQEWAVRYSTVEGTMMDNVDISSSSSTSVVPQDDNIQKQQQNGNTTNDNNNSNNSNNNNNKTNRIITRLFVFDSFDETCQTRVDLSKSTLGMDLIAFPPSDEQHSHMLDLHLKIVVNDLAVTFFKSLEQRIKESDDIGKLAATSKPLLSTATGGIVGSNSSTSGGSDSLNHSRPGGRAAAAAVSALANFAAGGGGGGGINNSSSGASVDLSGHGTEDDDSESGSSMNAASVNSSGATSSGGGGGGGGGLVRGMIRNAMNAAASSSVAANAALNNNNTAQQSIFGTTTHRLLTPLDEVIDMHGISIKNLEALQKREIGRREKYSADLSLMAGSPLDAYERYNRAAELTKASRDPLWYALSLQGCAVSFISMANHGGHGVDTYLENNFRMPDEILSIINAELLKSSDSAKRQSATMALPDKSKTTLPGAVFFLTEEALGILSKHPKLAPLYAELTLRLAVYTAEWEDIHRLCRWGYGPYCNTGEIGNIKRYDISSMSKLLSSVDKSIFNEQISKDTLLKCKKVIELLHKAVCTGGLDSRTRSDVALICAKICLKGITTCYIPSSKDSSLLLREMYNTYDNYNNIFFTTSGGAGQLTNRLRLPRKAAFFTTIAAESMSRCSSKDSSQRASNLWIALSQLYCHTENMYTTESTNYAWVSIRIAILHGLTQQVDSLVAEQAYEMLLVLLSEISPELLVPKGSGGKRSLVKLPPTSLSTSESTGTATTSSTGMTKDSSRRTTSGPAGVSGSNNSVSSGSNELEDYKNILNMSKPSPSASSSASNPTSNGRTSRGSGVGLFGGVGNRLSNTITHQAKWADDPQISNAILPLVELHDLIKRNMTKGTDDPLLQYVSTIYQTTLHLITFSCVNSKVTFDECSYSQQRFIDQLIHLRSQMPTKTSGLRLNLTQGSNSITSTGGGSSSAATSMIPPPLVIRSASVVKADSQLLLERTKASGYQGRNVGMSMQTFFNPYAAKSKLSSGSIQTTIIAEGEERTVEVIFENRLSVELDVPNCKLEFDPIGSKRIEAAPLSFIVPPKSKNFRVYFPFIVVPSNLVVSSSSKDNEVNNNDETNNVEDNDVSRHITKVDAFQLLGLRVTCMNRCFSVLFDDGSSSSSTAGGTTSVAAGTDLPQFVPNPASMYPLLKNTKKQQPSRPGGGGGSGSSGTKDSANSGGSKSSDVVPFQTVVRIETVPAQPTLNVSFITSETPLEDAAIVPVHLSDGEIYSIPPFRLQTDFGSSGQGRIERLQLIAAGLPGLTEEVLFDTEGLEAARKDDENFDDDEEMDNDHEEDDFEELMEEDGLPPLRMKVLTEDLHLGSINDKDKAQKEGSVVKFQIAAAHDMGNQLSNGGNVRIRFRYRGASPNDVTEIWRRTEVRLRIVRVKGPRISSLSFRPDLSWGSAFSELSHSLVQQRRRIDALPSSESEKHAQRLAALSSKPSLVDIDGNGGGGTTAISNKDGSSGSSSSNSGKDSSTNNISNILHRVGTDAATNVSGSEAVVLMAVANETNSTIVLSNREGRVGGFQGSPMPTIRVTSGVSVKIPVVIQRIERIDESNNVTDIVSELISRTALTWESLVGGGDTNEANKRVRRGRVRIPSRCLREIIDEHGSFASRICRAPITLTVDIGCKANENEVMLEPGGFVNAVARVKVNDWVPLEAISKCQLMLEFCCAPKFAAGASRNGGGNSSSSSSISASSGSMTDDETTSTRAPPYTWCGQLRRTFDGSTCVQSKNQNCDMIHQAKLSFLKSGSYAISACVKISLSLSSPQHQKQVAQTETNIIQGRKSTIPEEVWWAPRAETVLVEAQSL